MTEHETVTIQLPKSAMAYIRLKAELNKISVERELQTEIMDIANSEFEDMHAHEYLQLDSFKQDYKEIRGGEKA